MLKQLLIAGFFVIGLIPSVGQAVTIEDYMDQVALKNGGVRATKMNAESKTLRMDEGTLFFRPSFFINGEYYDDRRPTNAPTFQGNQTLRHTLRAGISDNFRTGTKVSLSYNYFKTQINGANPALLPNRKFFDVAPMIEVSQSLWRNFLGSEYEATETAQNSQTEADKWAADYTYKQLLMEAKNAYWRLYFAQTSLKVQKESLERAQKLKEWNGRLVKNNLVDESELLQAEANLQSREIEYQDTLTELDSAQRQFNSLRETEGDVVLETQDQEAIKILNAEVPMKGKMREDVLSSMAQIRAATANSTIGIQRNKPNLELYGTYAMYGRDSQYSNAYDQAMTATRPFSIVGVRFVTPLDFGSLKNYNKAYTQEITAAEMTYKRKVFEVEKEWEILTERFKNFKTRLKLSQKLEKVQERKLAQEKKRFSQGRTTTFQVLQFEQDFANTQLLKLRNERDLIFVHNQLQLFSGEAL